MYFWFVCFGYIERALAPFMLCFTMYLHVFSKICCILQYKQAPGVDLGAPGPDFGNPWLHLCCVLQCFPMFFKTYAVFYTKNKHKGSILESQAPISGTLDKSFQKHPLGQIIPKTASGTNPGLPTKCFPQGSPPNPLGKKGPGVAPRGAAQFTCSWSVVRRGWCA